MKQQRSSMRRSQESGVRSQESGVRSQESGVRSQESGVRSQESNDNVMVRVQILIAVVVMSFGYSRSQTSDQDYSRFLHTSSRHAGLTCTSCHHRTDNSVRPNFPGHKDCTSCHLTQFTTPNIPMCSICHESVNGSDPPRKGFPDRFRENFNVSFDHAQHLTGNAKPKNGCVACHSSPLRRGAALSIPTGLNAHAGCYTCHTPDSQANGRDLGSCGVCHATKAYARTPTDSTAYRQ